MEVTGAHPGDPLRRFHNHVVEKPQTGRYLCPRCDQRLQELVIEEPGSGTLTLDRCPCGHGLWFDAEELQQLLALYPPASGASRTIEYLNELFRKKSKT